MIIFYISVLKIPLEFFSPLVAFAALDFYAFACFQNCYSKKLYLFEIDSAVLQTMLLLAVLCTMVVRAVLYTIADCLGIILTVLADATDVIDVVLARYCAPKVLTILGGIIDDEIGIIGAATMG